MMLPLQYGPSGMLLNLLERSLTMIIAAVGHHVQLGVVWCLDSANMQVDQAKESFLQADKAGIDIYSQSFPNDNKVIKVLGVS